MRKFGISLRELNLSALWFSVLLASGGFVVVVDWSGYVYPFVFLFAALALGRAKVVIPTKSIRQLALLALVFLVSSFFREDVISYWPILLKMLAAAVLVCVASQCGTVASARVIVKVFEKLIILSLCVWIVANLFVGGLSTYGASVLGDRYETLLWIGYFRSSDMQRYGFFRNQSIFWEAGVFGVFCIYAFLLRVAVCKEKDSKVWLYTAGVLSSVSMGAILIFIPLAVYFQVHRTLGKVKSGATLWFALGSLLMGSVLVSVLLHFDAATIASWLFGRDVGDDSSIATRLMDLRYGYTASLSSPLIGHGGDYSAFYSATERVVGESKESYGGGMTNSLTGMSYQFGVPFVSAYLVFFYSSIKSGFNEHKTLVFAALLSCLMIEPLSLSIGFLVLLSWPASNKPRREPEVLARAGGFVPLPRQR